MSMKTSAAFGSADSRDIVFVVVVTWQTATPLTHLATPPFINPSAPLTLVTRGGRPVITPTEEKNNNFDDVEKKSAETLS
ncbi:hypothetical protein EYF80_050543 [Liparis tanakae]|uniref:Uncharacterized protein n=1 Tax=Liparis tanakae TaxID=230148 RepID=A0A4Z2FEX5_9TELE|nr:hypothetical protein EYF80_050543 [Liparis tanakae]